MNFQRLRKMTLSFLVSDFFDSLLESSRRFGQHLNRGRYSEVDVKSGPRLKGFSQVTRKIEKQRFLWERNREDSQKGFLEMALDCKHKLLHLVFKF